MNNLNVVWGNCLSLAQSNKNVNPIYYQKVKGMKDELKMNANLLVAALQKPQMGFATQFAAARSL